MTKFHDRSVPIKDYIQRGIYLSSLDTQDLLGELLSTIHSDNGEYIEEHGLVRAVLDAELKWNSARYFYNHIAPKQP